jgi:formyltetrahydrofolate-dependent phosphoribosylglycinamide formyltransferase
VLASGGGSNLQCLIDHFAAAGADAGTICWVGSDKTTAGALARAFAAGISSHVINDPSDGAALVATLRAAQADLLVLAGYLKLIPAEVVQAFHGRLINVHPALLPAFGGPGMYGQRIHSAVLAHGATVTGVTVHFVDEAYDRGPIIAQWPVPVLPGDTPATLGHRVLTIEHRLLPLCVEAVASGQLRLGADGCVHGQLHASDGADTASWRYALTPDPSANNPADTSASGAAFATDLARLFPR